MDSIDAGMRAPRRRATARIAGASLAAIALVLLTIAPAAAHEGSADLGLDDISITSATVDARTGLVTISGRIQCSQDLTQLSVYAGAEQLVGRLNLISGSGGDELDCVAEAGTADWSVSFYAWNGKFAPGQARVGASAFVFFCTEEECFEDGVETGVLLLRLTRA
jgi:hypothetical protein